MNSPHGKIQPGIEFSVKTVVNDSMDKNGNPNPKLHLVILIGRLLPKGAKQDSQRTKGKKQVSCSAQHARSREKIGDIIVRQGQGGFFGSGKDIPGPVDLVPALEPHTVEYDVLSHGIGRLQKEKSL